LNAVTPTAQNGCNSIRGLGKHFLPKDTLKHRARKLGCQHIYQQQHLELDLEFKFELKVEYTPARIPAASTHMDAPQLIDAILI